MDANTTRRDQLTAARALAAQATAAAEALEAALRNPERHDPIFSSANAVRLNLEAGTRIYSDWLNQR